MRIILISFPSSFPNEILKEFPKEGLNILSFGIAQVSIAVVGNI